MTLDINKEQAQTLQEMLEATVNFPFDLDKVDTYTKKKITSLKEVYAQIEKKMTA